VTDVKWLDIKEFRDEGLLQELNRLFLHPIGLALAVDVAEDGTETLHGIQDWRDDPEGVIYGDDQINPDKARNVRRLQREWQPRRIRELGYFIQPSDPVQKPVK
jgi:hypothetical protein